MLDAALSPGFYDVLAIEDPDFFQSEALCCAIEGMLDQTQHHDIIRIGALATLIVAYMRNAPPKHRNALTDSLLESIRREISDA